MSILRLFQLIPLFCSFSLVLSARMSVIGLKNENLSNCDITLDLSHSGLQHLGVHFLNNNCVRILKLQNNSIDSFEEKFFENQPYLEFLDLSRNRLQLNKFFSYGARLNLKGLILDHNNALLAGYHETVIENNQDDLLNDEVENKASTLTVRFVFPELRHLSLRHVGINDLAFDWINYFPKLRHLDLSENHFSHDTLNFLLTNVLSSVRTLVLENVGLMSVTTEKLNYIEELNLNHNSLERLKSHSCYESTLCLDNMDNLKILSVSNCLITYIEESAFKNVKNLVELDISNNLLSEIPKEMFSYVPSLQHLNLSNNTLYSMPNINGLFNLTTLVMDNMKGSNMLRNLISLPSLPNLRFLSMRNNKLSIVRPTLFVHLSNLEKVDLSKNQLKYLPSWETQKSLRQLHLSSNKFEKLEDISIKEAKSLELIDLKNNSISQIKVSSLNDLPNKNVILEL